MSYRNGKRLRFIGSEKARVESFLLSLKTEAENAVASFREKLERDAADAFARGSLAHWQSVVSTLNWIIERSQESWKERREESD